MAGNHDSADSSIRSIAIVGGGTAGWMSAAILSRFLDLNKCSVTLVESEEIGIVGVGEATVPLMQQFNGVLGIDENQFVAATNGSFKLGIEFRDWGRVGNIHFHGFGDYGETIEGVSPHHHWLKLHELGDTTPIDEYSFPYMMGKSGRFAPSTNDPQNSAAFFRYAFHFDAALYARFLRQYCEERGVKRVEGRVVASHLDSETGHIRSLQLEDGSQIDADFFIDCSGFGGLLIEQALKTGYEEWTNWLPCDRAVVVPSSRGGPPAPYTVSTAQAAGWQWRIPLQHRDGNGYVYSSGFADDEAARETLLSNLASTPLADTRVLRFVTGHRRKFWNRNCVAIGLAGGFMEPLESTSIQLIQTAIARLIEFFPDRNFDPAMITEYNRITTNEFERIRDFLILHYCLSQREEPLWEYCRNMEIPDSLAHKIEVWKSCGRVPFMTEESYQEPSWVAVFLGNGIIPHRYDPIIDRIALDRLKGGLSARRRAIADAVQRLPSHEAYINRFCSAHEAA